MYLKCQKASEFFRTKTYFQTKSMNQEGLIIALMEELSAKGNFLGKHSSWSSYFMLFGVGYIAHIFCCLWLLFPFKCLSLQCDSQIENVLQRDVFPGKSQSIVIDARRSCCSIGPGVGRGCLGTFTHLILGEIHPI